MTDPDEFTGRLDVDDLVTGRAAAQLGQGVLPTAAILIVQTISESGPGLRYIRSTDLMPWQALGLLRSTELHMEAIDLAEWDDS